MEEIVYHQIRTLYSATATPQSVTNANVWLLDFMHDEVSWDFIWSILSNETTCNDPAATYEDIEQRKIVAGQILLKKLSNGYPIKWKSNLVSDRTVFLAIVELLFQSAIRDIKNHSFTALSTLSKCLSLIFIRAFDYDRECSLIPEKSALCCSTAIKSAINESEITEIVVFYCDVLTDLPASKSKQLLLQQEQGTEDSAMATSQWAQRILPRGLDSCTAFLMGCFELLRTSRIQTPECTNRVVFAVCVMLLKWMQEWNIDLLSKFPELERTFSEYLDICPSFDNHALLEVVEEYFRRRSDTQCPLEKYALKKIFKLEKYLSFFWLGEFCPIEENCEFIIKPDTENGLSWEKRDLLSRWCSIYYAVFLQFQTKNPQLLLNCGFLKLTKLFILISPSTCRTVLQLVGDIRDEFSENTEHLSNHFYSQFFESVITEFKNSIFKFNRQYFLKFERREFDENSDVDTHFMIFVESIQDFVMHYIVLHEKAAKIPIEIQEFGNSSINDELGRCFSDKLLEVAYSQRILDEEQVGIFELACFLLEPLLEIYEGIVSTVTELPPWANSAFLSFKNLSNKKLLMEVLLDFIIRVSPALANDSQKNLWWVIFSTICQNFEFFPIKGSMALLELSRCGGNSAFFMEDQKSLDASKSYKKQFPSFVDFCLESSQKLETRTLDRILVDSYLWQALGYICSGEYPSAISRQACVARALSQTSHFFQEMTHPITPELEALVFLHFRRVHLFCQAMNGLLTQTSDGKTWGPLSLWLDENKDYAFHNVGKILASATPQSIFETSLQWAALSYSREIMYWHHPSAATDFSVEVAFLKSCVTPLIENWDSDREKFYSLFVIADILGWRSLLPFQSKMCCSPLISRNPPTRLPIHRRIQFANDYLLSPQMLPAISEKFSKFTSKVMSAAQLPQSDHLLPLTLTEVSPFLALFAGLVNLPFGVLTVGGDNVGSTDYSHILWKPCAFKIISDLIKIFSVVTKSYVTNPCLSVLNVAMSSDFFARNLSLTEDLDSLMIRILLDIHLFSTVILHNIAELFSSYMNFTHLRNNFIEKLQRMAESPPQNFKPSSFFWRISPKIRPFVFTALATLRGPRMKQLLFDCSNVANGFQTEDAFFVYGDLS
eukprot:GHVP01055190.1.p1 GENE.GHVP01055190.1~~GHVP01055190.1.p1  ORF type:complete len:1120 (+),score=188.70 GHVP01055190.1:35-3394(+)